MAAIYDVTSPSGTRVEIFEEAPDHYTYIVGRHLFEGDEVSGNVYPSDMLPEDETLADAAGSIAFAVADNEFDDDWFTYAG